jgi:hypothetical protein
LRQSYCRGVSLKGNSYGVRERGTGITPAVSAG